MPIERAGGQETARRSGVDTRGSERRIGRGGKTNIQGDLAAGEFDGRVQQGTELQRAGGEREVSGKGRGVGDPGVGIDAAGDVDGYASLAGNSR